MGRMFSLARMCVGTAFLMHTILQAEPSMARTYSPENFRYQFFGADVTQWQDGDGPPRDTQLSPAAAVLQEHLANVDHELLLALYGVKSQSWFMDAIRDLPRTVAAKAIVDQKQGEYGDWAIENFYYSDTPLLARLLHYRNVLPDLGPNGPRSSSIMHNKFIVLDREKLWFGTANLSVTGIGREYNANTMLIVDSKWFARAFAAEFDQMYTDQKFSTSKAMGTGKQLRYRDGTLVDIFFSPQDDAIRYGVIPAIRSCRRKMDIGMFFLTEPSVVEAIIAAEHRGCHTRIILDALGGRHPSSPVAELREEGVDIRIENWGGKMHMKTAVIDNRTVVIGSMNWTRSGNEVNDENTAIIKNTGLAGEVSAYFEKLWHSLDFYEDQQPGQFADPFAESPFSINSCFDGMDNDYDGLADDLDPGCRVDAGEQEESVPLFIPDGD